MRYLIVDDEPALTAMLARVLRGEGHVTATAGDAASALALAMAGDFDAIVLDWRLPDRSGVQVVRAMRAADVDTPVLMLTARDQVEDQVEALDAGADDFLSKPFAIAALLARLRALARRTRAPHGSEPVAVAVGDLVLDPVRHVVRRGAVAVALTPREFALLHALMRRPGQVLTRSVLLDSVWNDPGDLRTNVVELYVSYLRRKLDRPGQASCIRTVRGIGYALVAGS